MFDLAEITDICRHQISSTQATQFITRTSSHNSAANAEQMASDVPGIQEMRTGVVVAGSLALDLSCDFIPQRRSRSHTSPHLQTSNPASICQALGGVGHNIATAIHYLGADVQLYSIVGDDEAGVIARNILTAKGMSLSGLIQKTSARTAQYVAVNDGQKNLVLAMADMAILEGCHSEIDTVWKPLLDTQKPKWLVVDANWDPDTLHKWLMQGKAAKVKIAFEPVSVVKAQRLFALSSNSNFKMGTLPDHAVSVATPNRLELASMHTAAREAGLFERDDWWQAIDAMALSISGSRDKLTSVTSAALVDEGIPQQTVQLLPYIPTILTKLGDKGVLMTQILKPGDDRLTSPAHSRYILSRTDIDHRTTGAYT